MQDTTETRGSVLASLRVMAPNRRISLGEALQLAERQASRLLELCGAAVPIPTSIVTDQPRIIVEHDADLPAQAASGCSDWDQHRHAWVISLNPAEPIRRQRFTVLHEYKHILDHYHPGLAGRLPETLYGLDPMEYLAEYFAGCVLMPKRLLTMAYYDGIQHPADLAQLFGVSQRAIQVRLAQVGLAEPPLPVRRRSPTAPRAARYYRFARFNLQEVAA